MKTGGHKRARETTALPAEIVPETTFVSHSPQKNLDAMPPALSRQCFRRCKLTSVCACLKVYMYICVYMHIYNCIYVLSLPQMTGHLCFEYGRAKLTRK